ncbi:MULTISPECIES: LacI family DNA-binding transcriptional regulator [Microbacterium]|uniref:LacI family DNA-binding transcriptional regulator n=1 Tax=Microbacterium TaxID=33882 RepID=UPI0027804214|nr:MULTISPECIES: LacI family DNA-binding transcriptional regulator [Microbacterium]MDQ1082531.1 DNA-binding LacI/PurR family transcriptional regulator [Microbacterium sp. SORGH_AS_0344]MDQ1168697.1 DNA-binding LacI/PurR family transcriptional regulator [Microbacterium proteolyticum]
MVGIDDVARAAGVSTATVSRALSGRGPVSRVTRERVLAAADRLGYVVSAAASSLATGRTRAVGVVVPFLDRWFFSTVLAGISDALVRHGYDITLYSVSADAGERRRVFDDHLRRRRIDAVITIALESDAEESASLRGLGVPIVAIAGPNPLLTTLTVDDLAVGRLATAHLLELGHRHLAHIGADAVADAASSVPTLRRRGFEQSLAEAGVTAAEVEPADFTIDGGSAAATRVLSRGERPTALFAASDEMAIGAILAARALGLRVPEDVSIIGVDGHDLGRWFGLTTIDQFARGQGERAAEAVLDALDGRPPAPGRGTLPFELVDRGSTAPLAH